MEIESESGPSIEPRFSSSPRDDDDVEGRKSDRNCDSDNGNPSGAVVSVTAHMVGVGGPSSFAISVSTAPSTRVETSSSGSTETSWLTWVSSSWSEEKGQRKEGAEVEERYPYPASKTESAMQGVLSELPYPPLLFRGGSETREIRGEGRRF